MPEADWPPPLGTCMVCGYRFAPGEGRTTLLFQGDTSPNPQPDLKVEVCLEPCRETVLRHVHQHRPDMQIHMMTMSVN